MDTWHPDLDLGGNLDRLTVSATDVQDRPLGCGTFAGLKVRRSARSRAWSRRYGKSPFLLGIVREICCTLHDDPRIQTWEGLQEALEELTSRYSLHPGAQRYIFHAVESYLDAHESIEATIGPLKLLGTDPYIEGANKQLTAWAPVYGNLQGLREIRRIRLKTARPLDADTWRWTAVAARVASATPGQPHTTRIRVVEIGLADASVNVVFDGTPEEARKKFEEHAQPAINGFLNSTSYAPGHGCSTCKIAGTCIALIPLDNFLGQKTPGISTRSVSARDIEMYETCPAQWHLALDANLPTKYHSGAASERGRAIHTWLAAAHARGIPCSSVDLGGYDDEETFTAGLSEEVYNQIHGFLRNHITKCPMSDEVTLISIESAVYGYDSIADVIVASTPDMIFLASEDTLVIREFKTTQDPPKSREDAYDRFPAVAWLLNLFASGYVGPVRTENARVELEVISEEDSWVYSWDIRDVAVARMAKADIRRTTSAWHSDETWAATPGKHCAWCIVRKWCPDAHDPEDGDQRLLPLDEPCRGMQQHSSD